MPKDVLYERTMIQEVLPVYNVKVRVKIPSGKEIKRIYLAPDVEEVKYTLKDGYAEVTVPKLEYHRMVVTEFK